MKHSPDGENGVLVCALYRFTPLENFRDLQQPLLQAMRARDITGTLLLASEGINGTIAGEPGSMRHYLAEIADITGIDDLEVKESFTRERPFRRSRVKLKREIVTMGVPGIDPRQAAGTYVEPGDWNNLIDDPEVLVIDTRNHYEIEVGRFDNAVDPGTTNFREFPHWVDRELDPARHRTVAMYCTGGIRCEKSTALLRQKGFENVYHLKGGILKYLETVSEADTRWQGECFVFDERVTVDHQLERGSFEQCHACRMPISEQDMESPLYQKGVSCPHCHHQRSEADRERYAEREKQVALAESRGESHIGPHSQPGGPTAERAVEGNSKNTG